MLSLVVPVYKNEASLPRLLRELEALSHRIPDELEVVFVVDGSPDGSLAFLQAQLPSWPVSSQLVELSRNFGSFSAIGAGLAQARGEYLAVLAADLQEPPELIVEFHRALSTDEADVVLGCRTGRADAWWSRWLSQSFWFLYRRFVVREMPHGGVDVFGCNRVVRDRLLELRESETNMVALLLWLGFRRTFIEYRRRPRLEGRSAWTFGRKIRYAVNSIFNFTDLPVRALLVLGTGGTLCALVAGVVVLIMWSLGRIPVLGYTPLMLVTTFFGGLTALGLGIIGQYLWLSLQNVRRRPSYVVRTARTFSAQASTEARKSS
jgi:polyisoprenyl-phosphate glycosyltransferase